MSYVGSVAARGRRKLGRSGKNIRISKLVCSVGLTGFGYVIALADSAATIELRVVEDAGKLDRE